MHGDDSAARPERDDKQAGGDRRAPRFSEDRRDDRRGAEGRGERPTSRDGGRSSRRDDDRRGSRGAGGDRRASGSDGRGRSDRDDRRGNGDRRSQGGDRRYGDRDRPRHGERRFGDRDRPQGERRYGDRDRPQGERRYGDRDRPQGERRYGDRDRPQGERRYGDRDRRRDGERGFGDRDRPQGERRYGDRDRPRDGERRSFDRDGARGGDRRGFGGGDRAFERRGSYRDDRRDDHGDDRRERDVPRVPDPEIPEEITAKDLAPSARFELKTLSKENAENVARLLAAAAAFIGDDPERAHEYAKAAMRHAGRVGVVRETLAVTAYAVGDFALALRELRTHRRITGSNEAIALIVDAERGVGRPEKALEEGRAVDPESLPMEARIQLAIAMSGARLDLGQLDLALTELDVPGVDPNRALPWSPAFFAAKAAVHADLGEIAEAERWQRRADIAADVLATQSAEAGGDTLEIESSEDLFALLDDATDDRVDSPTEHDASDAASDIAEPADSATVAINDTDDEVGDAGAVTVETGDSADSVDDEVAQILRDAGIDDDDASAEEGTDGTVR